MARSVLLKSPFNANTGYGNDGFSLARSLHQTGLDVHLRPMTIMPPVPAGVAQLLIKSPERDFDLVLHHADPDSLGLTAGEQRLYAKKVAWSMWEFLKYHDPHGNFVERLSAYDMLIAYDEVSHEAFAPYCERAGVELRVLQGGIWADDWNYDNRERDWSGTFRFAMVGNLNSRKNPFAALEAFREVHAEFPDTEFHFKTVARTMHPAIMDHNPGVRIHYEMWDQARLREFYKGIHCYVAPSWGEGKNLPALESQLMGVPAIYSDYGGHRQWGSRETGWPVPGTIAEHEPGLPSFRVDHDALVAAMKEAVRNRHLTRVKGEQASRIVRSSNDWLSVIDRLLAIV